MLNGDWLDERRAEEIAQKVREELARRRMSRQGLADLARISISTLEKALTGRRSFTLATVIRLEEALGTSLRGGMPAAQPHPSESAPDSLGGYNHGAVRWLEGRYWTLRPVFRGDPGVFAYLTTIRWEPACSCLVFSEGERGDAHAQHGQVSMPHMSGHIYLVTSEEGQYRLAILGRPNVKGSLYGVLTTLLVGHGSQLVPASAPIALLRLEDGTTPACGRIDVDHPDYAACRAEIDTVIQADYARFPDGLHAS
ncbi:multiprotein-bridging factor 1 family protein [Allosphingosinicella sp.]|uniref:helix-turn-helix domain-containing protein n=1 Tax=Allosphingosinicella sp. TaxID=2823234 RepID=UPI003783AF35